jgi:hypothetical protein
MVPVVILLVLVRLSCLPLLSGVSLFVFTRSSNPCDIANAGSSQIHRSVIRLLYMFAFSVRQHSSTRSLTC